MFHLTIAGTGYFHYRADYGQFVSASPQNLECAERYSRNRFYLVPDSLPVRFDEPGYVTE